MDKENKKPIALVILFSAAFLAILVNMTFSQYTTTLKNEEKNKTDIQSIKDVGKTYLDMSSVAANNNANIKYPGGIMVLGAKVIGSTDGDYTYNIAYSLTAKIDSTSLKNSNSKLKWTIYQTTSEIKSDLVSGCELVPEEAGEKTNYYYKNCKANITGTVIESGTITDHSKATEITIKQKFESVDKNTPKDTYYYIVVEYVNETNSNQAVTDAGKTIYVYLQDIVGGESVVVIK